ATPMNLTLAPYFLAASIRAGSSSLQLGHQVAQNSISIGVLPMYWERLASLPSRVVTTAAGAVAPIWMPRSWARAAAGSASATASKAEIVFISTDSYDQLSHLHQVVFGDADHHQGKEALDPHHPRPSPRQPGERSRRQPDDDEQGAHSEREDEQIDESERGAFRRRDPGQHRGHHRCRAGRGDEPGHRSHRERPRHPARRTRRARPGQD